MSRFHHSFSTRMALLKPLRRLWLAAGLVAGIGAGFGVCSIVLAGDAGTTTVVAADEPTSLHIQMSVKTRPAVSYALIRAHGTTVFSGASRELRQVTQLQKDRAGQFLWIRKGDSEYVLEDATAIAELLQRWQALKAPEQEMAALEQQLQPYTEQLEVHAEQIEGETNDWQGGIDHDAVAKLHEQMESLHEKIEPISDQMAVLGQQIETLADDAHQFTLQRIEAALQAGTAKPLPAS